MIYVDDREKPAGASQQLADAIRRFGVHAEVARLPYGDFCFDGFDSDGPISVGVERKRIHDMLTCVDDARYNQQRVGMAKFYGESWLVLEGLWRFHDPKGLLMEGNTSGAWWECRPFGRSVMYSKLSRYLFSVSRSGVGVIETRDMMDTAYDVVELYHYYSKKKHTAMLEIKKPNIAVLTGRPSLTRRWAEALEGVGQTYGEQADKLFKTPIALAMSEPMEWQGIRGIGGKTAADICRQIAGEKR